MDGARPATARLFRPNPTQIAMLRALNAFRVGAFVSVRLPNGGMIGRLQQSDVPCALFYAAIAGQSKLVITYWNDLEQRGLVGRSEQHPPAISEYAFVRADGNLAYATYGRPDHPQSDFHPQLAMPGLPLVVMETQTFDVEFPPSWHLRITPPGIELVEQLDAAEAGPAGKSFQHIATLLRAGKISRFGAPAYRFENLTLSSVRALLLSAYPAIQCHISHEARETIVPWSLTRFPCPIVNGPGFKTYDEAQIDGLIGAVESAAALASGQAAEGMGAPGTAALELPSARHSEDFRSVHWYGQHFSFTALQAACVKELWAAWEQGTPDVSTAKLLEAAESGSRRMVDLFRNSPAWQTLIVTGATKGTKRLADPKS